MAFDPRERRLFLLIEAMKDGQGTYRGRVAEYDAAFAYQGRAWLPTVFDGSNRGFEGLTHVRRDGAELLWALCEGNLCSDADEGGGWIQVFERAPDRSWSLSHEVALPAEVEFADYSALSISDRRVAVVSQRDARLWCGRLDDAGRGLEPGGSVYRFPKGSYCNVEGVSWLAPDRLLAVSDRRQKAQRGGCAGKDQSIHVFRLPAAADLS